MKKIIITSVISFLFVIFVSACQALPFSSTPKKVLAIETFLADITKEIAGDRLVVESLIPAGTDPHSFEPTPKDLVKVAESQIIVLNGAGLEEWAEELLENATKTKQIKIEASEGLKPREHKDHKHDDSGGHHHHEGDPHFWLDPNLVIHYVENIRDGLIQADPGGKATYQKNAEAYIGKLKELDQFIQKEVSAIPPERRLLVTNHESFGYFADRYGFQIVGTILPSFTSGASPSAQELARLIDQIKASKVKAIFLETGTNPQLAEQIAKETGAKVVTDLFTHSLTEPGGKAPTYITMMKHNATTIVNNLK